MSQVVLVTGATSFIGSHVINLLLQENWKVRGTVRSLTSTKTKAIQEVFERFGEQLELVEADLKRAEGWAEACQGCTYVLHLACPVETTTFSKDPMNRVLKDPPEVKAAIDIVVTGTLCIIDAAKAAGVKRFVMTSSVAAMIPKGWCETSFPYPSTPGAHDPEGYQATISDDTWTDESIVDGYLVAKTRSEREAWKAVQGSSLEFVCINPGYVFGPQLHKAIVCDSVTPIDIAMNQPPGSEKQLPAMPSMKFACADVRDVAKAHVQGMLKPQAAGNRYLVAALVMDGWDIQSLLGAVFKPKGYSTMDRKMPKCIVGLLACCDPLMARIYMNWEKYPKIDNSKLRRDLIPDLMDMKESIFDTVYASVKTGRYERKPGFKSGKPEYDGPEGFISLQASL